MSVQDAHKLLNDMRLLTKDAVHTASYTHPSSTKAPPISSIPDNMENLMPSLGSLKEESLSCM